MPPSYGPQQQETDDQGQTRPWDLVNQFASMQKSMRPPGQGLGPFGQQRRRPETQPFQPPQGPQPQQQQAPATPATGLVNWGGRQIDSSVVGYANQIASMFPGLRFTSGHRDAAANARANGSPTSWHLKGRALDWSGSARDMQNAKVWAEQNGAREAMIHNAGSGTHLHVAW